MSERGQHEDARIVDTTHDADHTLIPVSKKTRRIRISDRAWGRYLESIKADRARGIVSEGNVTYHGAPPPASFWNKKYY